MLQTRVSPSTATGLPTVVTDEVPTGVIDGVNTIFTLANPVNGDSLKVYLNGLSQRTGASHDYTVLSATQIQFNDAPLPDDVVTVDYEYL